MSSTITPLRWRRGAFPTPQLLTPFVKSLVNPCAPSQRSTVTLFILCDFRGEFLDPLSLQTDPSSFSLVGKASRSKPLGHKSVLLADNGLLTFELVLKAAAQGIVGIERR